MGGLGNQMFQYALAYALREKGTETAIDTSYFYNIPASDTVRKSYEEYLNYGLKHGEAHFNSLMTKSRCFYWRLCKKLNINTYRNPVYFESETSLPEKVLNYRRGILIGYWQNQDYFTNVVNDICEMWTNRISKSCSKKMSIARNISIDSKAVSIHVRGNDYNALTNQNRFGGICTNSYYSNAIREMEKIIGKGTYYVFSDDYSYADSILPRDKEYIIVDGDEGSCVEDLYLMSLCKHHIIANSSYSWWGAFLYRKSDGVVFAPDKWDRITGENKICPLDWVRIRTDETRV